jgi:hypothetical protein
MKALQENVTAIADVIIFARGVCHVALFLLLSQIGKNTRSVANCKA